MRSTTMLAIIRPFHVRVVTRVHRLVKLLDGNYWYHQSPPNRWVSRANDTNVTINLDLGVSHPIDQLVLYLLDDADGDVKLPASI